MHMIAAYNLMRIHLCSKEYQQKLNFFVKKGWTRIIEGTKLRGMKIKVVHEYYRHHTFVSDAKI